MHVGSELRPDVSRRWFMLSQTGLSITPSPSSILPLELHPLVIGRTVPQRKRQHPPHPLEKVFFFVLQSCAMSRAEPWLIMPSVIIFSAQGSKEWEMGSGRRRRRRKGREVDGWRSQKRRGWGLEVVGAGGLVGGIDGSNGNPVNWHRGCEVGGRRVPA